jgi:hypothetical protein
MGGHIMKSWIVLVLVPLLAAGCGLFEPKDTEPVANEAPNTVLTAAPLESAVNTYLAPISWRGEDGDGVVLGFYVTLDGYEWYTTRSGSVFTFSSTSGEGDSLSDQHTLSVAAVDDDAARDQSPAAVTFNSYTYLPETFIAGIEDGAEVGQAVRFELSGLDPDDYVFTYVYAMDDTSTWTAIDTPLVIFADLSLVTAVPGYGDYVSDKLEPGAHTFYAKARDRALAYDPSAAAVAFTVLAGTEPETEIFGGMVGEELMFLDGSAYSAASGLNRVELWVRGDASAYTGRLHSLQYSLDGVASAWLVTNTPDSTALVLSSVASGMHDVTVKARDTAGNADSSPAELDLGLLMPDLSGEMVVVHETADGSGGPGSPTGADVDAFYELLLSGQPHVVAYWDTLGEITPGQAGNAELILWHSDDRTESFLGDGSRFLRQYLSCVETYGLTTRPKLIVSGFNVLVGFLEDATADTVEFAEGDFPYDYWGIQGGVTTGAGRELNRAVAAKEGYPELAVDATKLPTPWRGNLPNTWLLTPGNDDEVLYTLASDDGTSEYEGLPCALLHTGQDADCIILSFPLYFMDEASATAFLAKALSDLGL